jgi:preprotein translocase subunit SecB
MPIVLQPINFEMLYQQQAQAAEATAGDGQTH